MMCTQGRRRQDKVMEFGRIRTACLATGKHHNTTIWTFCWMLRVLHQSSPRIVSSGRAGLVRFATTPELCCRPQLFAKATRKRPQTWSAGSVVHPIKRLAAYQQGYAANSAYSLQRHRTTPSIVCASNRRGFVRSHGASSLARPEKAPTRTKPLKHLSHEKCRDQEPASNTTKKNSLSRRSHVGEVLLPNTVLSRETSYWTNCSAALHLIIGSEKKRKTKGRNKSAFSTALFVFVSRIPSEAYDRQEDKKRIPLRSPVETSSILR
jgi:hypothetical protein